MKNTILILILLLLHATKAYSTMLYDVDPNGLGGNSKEKTKLFYETELYDPDKQHTWISIVPRDLEDNHDSTGDHDPTNPVPEPATLLLLGSGLTITAIKLKRKK